jgi:hypothetical protein
LSGPGHLDRSLVRDLGRRRVALFFFVLLIVALLNTITEESDFFLRVLDDYVIVSVSVVGIALVAARWKKQTPDDLRKLNTVLLVLGLVVLVMAAFAISQEYTDAADLADDPVKIILGVFFLINRYM